MTEMGKYIYGIRNSCAPLSLPQEGELAEIDTVYASPYEDISAVVSDAETVDYTHRSKDTLAPLLAKHQKVIETVMELEYDIIPVRLGTFALDEAEIKQILEKGYKLIKSIFRKTTGKIEIDIVATWSDFSATLKDVGEDREIREFKENFLANPKGVTVDDQMKVGVMIKRCLDRRKEEYVSEIHSALSSVCCDSRTHEALDDKLVGNFAFLLDKSKRGDFDTKMREVDCQFGGRLHFRCVGPLPLYNFYSLEIRKMRFKDFDWARKMLGLNGSASREEIKKAHRFAALSSHPDSNPHASGSKQEFDDITKAYKILLAYCLACDQAGQSDRYPLGEQDFEQNALLVKVRE